MKFKKRDPYQGRMVDVEASLKGLLTIKRKHVLISLTKPRDEWTRADSFWDSKGLTPSIPAAMNHSGAAAVAS